MVINLQPQVRTEENIRFYFLNPNLNQNDELKSLVLGFRLTLDARSNDQFFFDPRHKILSLKMRKNISLYSILSLISLELQGLNCYL